VGAISGAIQSGAHDCALPNYSTDEPPVRGRHSTGRHGSPSIGPDRSISVRGRVRATAGVCASIWVAGVQDFRLEGPCDIDEGAQTFFSQDQLTSRLLTISGVMPVGQIVMGTSTATVQRFECPTAGGLHATRVSGVFGSGGPVPEQRGRWRAHNELQTAEAWSYMSAIVVLASRALVVSRQALAPDMAGKVIGFVPHQGALTLGDT